MNISNSEIRAKARASLGGQIFNKTWLMAIVVAVIIGAVIGAANSISCGIASLLLTGPLYVGLHSAFLKIARGDSDVKIETTFEGCRDFGPNLVLGLMHSLIITLWSLLFIIPGIIKSYSYCMAYFVKVDHPEYGWRECLDESERMMKGNRMKYFWLQLSFIGWALVGSLACGLGVLWVNAYQSTSNAIFYEELKKSSNFSYTTE